MYDDSTCLHHMMAAPTCLTPYHDIGIMHCCTYITSITAAAIITHIDGLVEKLDVYCSIIKIIMMNGFVPQIFVPHE